MQVLTLILKLYIEALRALLKKHYNNKKSYNKVNHKRILSFYVICFDLQRSIEIKKRQARRADTDRSKERTHKILFYLDCVT